MRPIDALNAERTETRRQSQHLHAVRLIDNRFAIQRPVNLQRQITLGDHAIDGRAVAGVERVVAKIEGHNVRRNLMAGIHRTQNQYNSSKSYNETKMRLQDIYIHTIRPHHSHAIRTSSVPFRPDSRQYTQRGRGAPGRRPQC